MSFFCHFSMGADVCFFFPAALITKLTVQLSTLVQRMVINLRIQKVIHKNMSYSSPIDCVCGKLHTLRYCQDDTKADAVMLVQRRMWNYYSSSSVFPHGVGFTFFQVYTSVSCCQRMRLHSCYSRRNVKAFLVGLSVLQQTLFSVGCRLFITSPGHKEACFCKTVRMDVSKYWRIKIWISFMMWCCGQHLSYHQILDNK